ncbi:MAG TPA: arsenic transporter [Clostridiaceae bacterium]|nr:arsenic transporter [Clostridiaceae bacterium]
MLQALIIFVVTYILMIVLSEWRWLIALASAALYVLLGIFPVQGVLSEINWNVIFMIVGTMGTVALFIESKMPAKLADMIIDRSKNEMSTIIALSVFAGIISAFVDNVATVLMVAPLALTISKKIGSSPVPAVIAISVASNLEGAATLVGDTTSILLASYAGKDFFDFFWYEGSPGLFFINQIGLLCATLVLVWLFREKKREISIREFAEVTDYIPTFALLATILLLIMASFMDLSFLPGFIRENINGVICMAVMILAIIAELMRHRKLCVLTDTLIEIDIQTVVLLASLFVVIGAIREAGVIDEIGRLFFRIGGDNYFLMYTLIVWSSVLLSAFIDNIPYVMTMLPVVSALAAQMGQNPTVLYFGLLCGATLGGNLTPIGASANIAGIGMLRKNGHEVANKTFLKLSVPYTLAAVSSAYILVWLAWA